MSYTLAIDQGSHATRAILFDAQGNAVETAEQPVELRRLDAERVEQDANEILQSVHHVLAQLPGEKLRHTTACGLATQRSTVIAWNKHNGQPLAPALSWQDRRSWQDMESFSHDQRQIKQITGLPLSPHYSAGKFRWLLHNHPAVKRAAREQSLCLSPLASYLMFHLLQNAPICIDHCNAQRTLLFDLQQLNWSGTLLNKFQIAESLLPKCQPVRHDYGRLNNLDIPLRCVTGDQNAAIFALGELARDSALINIGTGAFILCHSDHPKSDTRLLNGLAMSQDRQARYLLEATVNGAGAALSWARQHWPVDELFQQLPVWLEQHRSPPIFINTVGGLGSPWWKPMMNPEFMDADEATVADRYVAIIESIVFLLIANLSEMQTLQHISHIQLSGGLARLDGLCQKLSDLSRLPVLRSPQRETTARGVAWLASGQADWQLPAEVEGNEFFPNPAPELLQRYSEFCAIIHSL